jgi:hypothetical protein
MSRTSEPSVDALIDRGLSRGMAQVEARRWGRMLDPVALDSCGCVAAARAATVVGLLTLPLVAMSRRRRTKVAQSASFILLAAIGGSLLGRHQAARMRGQVLTSLEGRVGQLELRADVGRP